MAPAEIIIGTRRIGLEHPVYFVADIAANHDGSIDRALALIRLAAKAGADAAKFQNFRAGEIVSDYGFKKLGSRVAHQSKWEKSVFEVYQDASIPWEWTERLKQECLDCGIDYFSTPYDFAAVEMLSRHVPAFKIGSGDITWLELLDLVARQNRPVLLATGASTLDEIREAMKVILRLNSEVCLMQCNTNYTGSLENFRHIHLRVLESFNREFPQAVLGLSDHTPGHATVLGAVALGARIIEKHFTDDVGRPGPDHHFSMTPSTWKEMVDRVRELELALGSSQKEVMPNERETLIVQRRCVRLKHDLTAGSRLSREDLEVLRPAEPGAIMPGELNQIIGRVLRLDRVRGQALNWPDLV